MSTLAGKRCIPCESGTPPAPKDNVEHWLKEVNPDWRLIDDGKKIERQYSFADFLTAMAFVNDVARVAEAEGHHPDIYIFYSEVKLTLWTHAARGLTENDFILAAKIDALS